MSTDLQDTSTPPPPAPPPDDLPETVIEPGGGWGPNLPELWAHRELIYHLAWRDLKVRYRQTWIGAAWAMLQPLMMTTVFTIFFGPAAVDPTRPGLPYPLFVYSGFVAWQMFSSSLMGAGMSVVHAEALIGKVYFPRLAIPLASVLVNVVDFLVACGGLLLLMLYYRVPPAATVLLLPAWLLIIALAAFGVGTLLAALNVRYRDFRHLMPFLVQVWMFSTPAIFLQSTQAPVASVFGSSSLYDAFRRLLLHANPLNNLIVAFRTLVFQGEVPWAALAVSAALALALTAVGCAVFRHAEDTFADII